MSLDDLPPDDVDHTSVSARPCVVHITLEPDLGGTVSVRGDMDMTAAPVFRQAVDRLVDEGARSLRIDLSGVSFIDSSGLGSLVYGYRRLRDRDGDIVVCGVGPQPARVLRITHLDRILSVEAAAVPAAPRR
ncbi:STAS domain-containing protein [Embleya scabrispora]|uniref:STAS domain-containing protein n=1 Tax=Embleya scabrispora TaxID=159449 RepID=UPI000369F655|nr:STAS domain-containing protein [Embleya scabrispora]MYS80703.1 anti-sigma factor antagonist [Streptomyces sp. SID5474]